MAKMKKKKKEEKETLKLNEKTKEKENLILNELEHEKELLTKLELKVTQYSKESEKLQTQANELQKRVQEFEERERKYQADLKSQTQQILIAQKSRGFSPVLTIALTASGLIIGTLLQIYYPEISSYLGL